MEFYSWALHWHDDGLSTWLFHEQKDINTEYACRFAIETMNWLVENKEEAPAIKKKTDDALDVLDTWPTIQEDPVLPRSDCRNWR